MKANETMENGSAKQFDLTTILSITTGINLNDIDKILAALEFITGRALFTHELPEALPIASKKPFRIS